MKATHIVAVQAGWVFVGVRAESGAAPGIVQLTGAACIRKWGTSRGLGELALSGPQAETALDPCGTVEIPALAVLFCIPVDPTKWQS